MYLLSRHSVTKVLSTILGLLSSMLIFSQTQYLTPLSVSGGTRTLYIDNPTVSNCPNTYEYVPNGFNINDPAVKYPIIIGFPGLSEMIGPVETNSQAMDKFINPNIYLNAGIQQIVEQGNFPATTTYNSQNYQFIVIGVQCKNNASNTAQTPLDVQNLLNNYIFVKYADKIDWNRIYLTGLSAGGGLVWEYIENTKRAGMIAAIVPIAPGTVYVSKVDGTVVTSPTDYTPNFNTIINNVIAQPGLGVFAVHNNGDQSVNVEVSKRFVNTINGIQTNRANIRIFDPPPDPPTDHNAWVRAYDPTKFEFNGQNMYQWLLSNQNPTATAVLPVTLTNFDAVAKGSAVELSWNTASESNSSYFAVERSSDRQEWKEIGRVKASGNSTTAKNYRFTDNAPLSGNNYYRLKMVDLDASFKWSEIRKVGMNGSDLEFSFGPNPVLNEASIRISGNQRTRLNITVTDLMGRTLRSISVSKTENMLNQKINLADLPGGQYVLSIKGDHVNYTQRIMKR